MSGHSQACAIITDVLFKNFSKIASPFKALLAKVAKFNRNEKCEKSFTELKEALVTAPVLKYLNMNEPFIL